MFHQGKQYIPDVRKVEVPGPFRGRPVISGDDGHDAMLEELCPTGAIKARPMSVDLGRCVFCGECQAACPSRIRFTKDYRMATNVRGRLVIGEGSGQVIRLDDSVVRTEIRRYFGGSLKLRQVSAGGDNSCEWELNAAGNVNFDMGRFGIEFVASPRHADGIVITGPLTANMAHALELTFDAVPDPRLIILAGSDAISGGIFDGSKALDRGFINSHTADLYVPGNPVHPLTFINGVLDLMGKADR